MTAALLGFALIVLIAVVTVALGALSRLLAVRIAISREEHERLSAAERIALGDSLVARGLRPDATHPVARTAPHSVRGTEEPGPEPRQDLAVRFPDIAAHALR